jgi:hypothetical protein
MTQNVAVHAVPYGHLILNRAGQPYQRYDIYQSRSHSDEIVAALNQYDPFKEGPYRVVTLYIKSEDLTP